ncbi:MAG: DUF4340 domain-containing protein [Alphaproteobacteria bacterium]|nr:MAG: DUF4340 domain-containing protein [Alphaproteobacteria bacterium]
MNSNRTLIILLVVTVIAVLAAAVVVVQQQASVTSEIERTALFPDLDEEIGSVVALTVRSAEGEVVVRRAEAGWVVPAKHDYPADRARVREVLLALTRMEAVEPKTAQPELYERLGVSDPDRPGSRATLLSLRDAAGGTIAALLIGDRAPARGVYGRDRTGVDGRAYVRKAGDAQSWLALGVPDISADPDQWIDHNLLTLPRERIRRITISHPDGSTVRLFRDSPGEENFTIADLPRGRRAKTGMGPESTAAALSFLSFDDVKPAEDVDWSGATRTVYTAFDGLELTIRIKDGWAAFEAAYRIEVAEEGEGTVVLPSSPPDGEAEARRLNARYGGWAYKLPAYKVDDLTPTMDDLTEPAENEAES